MSSNSEYEQQQFWNKSEMNAFDLSKSKLPHWYPDITALRQEMFNIIGIPEDRLNINFEEIKWDFYQECLALL